MSFREKSAWWMAIVLGLTAAGYVFVVAMMSQAMGRLAPPLIPLLVVFTFVLTVLAAGAYAAVVSLVLLKAIDAVVGLRVEKDEEREGLDAVLHGESGYTLGSMTMSAFTAHGALDEEKEAR